ncbi:MAG TPA: GNAT family N-acetyltransferase [Chloroflexota bacterium]|nr:GNAT family N-acetyltransferase [Chloroflexota bacterium]
MSSQTQPTDQELAIAAEQTIYTYSWIYECERETLLDTGDALVHILAVPWFGDDGFAGRLVFDPETVNERLDVVLRQAGDSDRRFIWITGPSTSPANVSDLLAARGLLPRIFWDGLALRDLSWPYPEAPGVRVRQLTAESVDTYVDLCIEHDPTSDESVRAERRAAAMRLVAAGQREAQVFIAYVDGEPAGCSVLRMEPDRIAYLRNAFTLEAFRQRGVYLAMVGARLALAREHGCVAAVVQAQGHSSAPILRKRGFFKVCELVGHARAEGGVGD